MALKVLLLRKQLENKRRELADLVAKDADFAKREAEMEAAIDEITSDEQVSTVQEAVDCLRTEMDAHQAAKTELERAVTELEGEIAQEEAAQETEQPKNKKEHGKDEDNMNDIRENTACMAVRDRLAQIVTRDDVKGYLGEIRTCIKEKRALTNVGLTIPEVLLGLLRENVINYSKLYRHVFVRRLSGDGRLVVMGTVPEAIWTDCCANLNELDLAFSDVEVNCWKVGGYFAVCNATLEDSDIDLASELVTALGQAIGLALDKAILYGTGSRMPLGIVTRLAQTEQPAGYSTTERAWVDLHTSNIKSIADNVTDAALFKALVINAGAAKGKYSRGEKVWCMNEATYTKLISNALTINSAGAIVAGVQAEMPVIGGVIEVLNFIPDNVIVGGYFDLYLLAERAGERFATSEHYKFLADQTVFKGTARYDGKPVIAEAFVAIGLGGVTPNATMTFAPDDANSVQSLAINTQTATVKVSSSIQLYAITAPGSAPVVWTSGTTAKATVNSSTGVVTGVSTGTSTITATCGTLTASALVTVQAADA